ncbi:MAG TPA: hypothetical protein VMH50_15260 [Thermoleophilia bacterium]|nr:hypothetical protein [Thermoleophilia bacterium]
MTGPASRARVLAFADVTTSVVAAARLHAPLRALRAAGLIEAFAVTDATLRGAPRGGNFDVIWLQRGADAWLAKTLAARLPHRFMLDVDDHLLCRPSYLAPGQLPDPGAVSNAIAACKVLTTPTLRLARLLQSRSGVSLEEKTAVCPNAVDFSGLGVSTPRAPQAILLTQSHHLALTTSAGDILGAVAGFAARRRLPIWSLGAPVPELVSHAAQAGIAVKSLRTRAYDRYHAGLAHGPALLGVAPLETRGDGPTNEFVAGKSDIKMVEFGGFGHTAVYSAAPPYTDTDLACGRLADNDAASWTAALEAAAEHGWRTAPDEARAVREQRDLARVAAEMWWPAVQAARLEQPVDAAHLFTLLEKIAARARDRADRVRWRIARDST